MTDISACYRELGFAEAPFNVTPDTSFFFSGKEHSAALKHLEFGLTSDGFTMLTGEVGLGKTLLCRQLLKKGAPGVRIAYIYNTFIDFIDLMKAIYYDITGIHLENATYSKLFHEINQVLIELASHGEKVVVLLDEAHRLKPKVLEGLRLLSNLETEKRKLLSFIMVGQPELQERLKVRTMRPLAERISVRFKLQPLGFVGTMDYIRHRLGAATFKVRSVKFTDMAMLWAYFYSRGVPRRINQICDRALLAAFSRSSRKITAFMVMRAAKEVKG